MMSPSLARVDSLQHKNKAWENLLKLAETDKSMYKSDREVEMHKFATLAQELMIFKPRS